MNRLDLTGAYVASSHLLRHLTTTHSNPTETVKAEVCLLLLMELLVVEIVYEKRSFLKMFGLGVLDVMIVVVGRPIPVPRVDLRFREI